MANVSWLMIARLFACLLSLLSVVSGAVLSTGPQRGRPGLKSPLKLWWTKELATGIYVSGRPSVRWIKYAYEGGFKSILSVFQYWERGSFGGEYLPTTVEASSLATSLGLQYVSVLDVNADWKNLDTVRRFSDAVNGLTGPMLLHCNSGYSVTFLTLMYMANQTRYDPMFEPKVNSATILDVGTVMEMDYTSPVLKDLVSLVTGEPPVTNETRSLSSNPAQTPTLVALNWRKYWPAQPIGANWFMAGQIRRRDVGTIESARFRSVINLRLGEVYRGWASQEQVSLLNIKDTTWTYGSPVDPCRQCLPMLERSRINPNLDPDYIGPDSVVNYERLNPEEFGDAIGYNEYMERDFFRHRNITYYHLPVDYFDVYRPGVFSRIKNALMEAGAKGPVLLHCNTGKRAAHIGVLAVAVQENRPLEWALDRLQQLGYTGRPDLRPDIYHMYRRTLSAGNQRQRVPGNQMPQRTRSPGNQRPGL